MSENILEVRNVVKNYANHTALSEVSLSVPKGVIYGLLGPNGAGKTSLIRIVNQITAPDAGDILFDGKPLNEHNIYEIGYLPEERGLYKKMKVGEHLLYLARLKGLNKDQAMEKLKEWFIKFDIKTWWDKHIEDLSKGMQQKIQFVATVLHEPKLIILDEPFSGFDPINATLIKDEILELKEKGSTIIFSTHRMESVEELCDYIALINNSKKVLEGRKSDIKQQYKSNTFTVEFEKGALKDGNSYAIQNVSTTSDGNQLAVIKAVSGVQGNQILSELMQQVEIKLFKEDVASMNDVFIKAVNQSN
ncbi:MAG: ATP-binding cassette domain-containing protein [Bacteroidetes bacterium]|jgi:ABC-2 type transport system ATP-binding protein|nr:ATP-binding cassette domain-containing protein [Bacteroidota bacterium]